MLSIIYSMIFGRNFSSFKYIVLLAQSFPFVLFRWLTSISLRSALKLETFRWMSRKVAPSVSRTNDQRRRQSHCSSRIECVTSVRRHLVYLLHLLDGNVNVIY